MGEITFDVMLKGRFQGTFKHTYCPAFPIKVEELMEVIEKRKPSLKGKPYNIENIQSVK